VSTIEGRCVCGAIISERIRLKAIRNGIECWNCGRVWGFDPALKKILLISGPTKAPSQVTDDDLNR
jgi:hypothetical protein